MKTKNKNGIVIQGGDRAFYIVTAIILVVFMVIVLYPLYFVVIASVSDVNAIKRGDVLLWPQGFQLDAYKRVFDNPRIMLGFRNTFIYAVFGTVLNVALTMTAGYGLSRRFHGRKIVMFLITFTMFFGGGMIPTYFLIKDLHLLDNPLVMILPGAVGAYNLIIARTFLSSNIPDELYEAAEMDGCTHLRFFASVVVPLSGSLIAMLTLFSVVGHWNSYFNALLYLNKRVWHPLQLVLREILIQNNVPTDDITDPDMMSQMAQIKELLKYALIVVSSIPMLLIYPFIQKYFVKGVMIGSIKE
jgi:ABC-type glycerol-3-phosphate transport system permease component